MLVAPVAPVAQFWIRKELIENGGIAMPAIPAIGSQPLHLTTAHCRLLFFFVLGLNARVEFVQWRTIGLIPICACRLAGRER